LVKLEKRFRQYSLKREQDPDILITKLQDYRMRLKELGSRVSESQFILHILNNMTGDFNSQIAMMDKRVMKKSNPLLSTKFKR
jgi:hypothetical protein